MARENVCYWPWKSREWPWKPRENREIKNHEKNTKTTKTVKPVKHETLAIEVISIVLTMLWKHI